MSNDYRPVALVTGGRQGIGLAIIKALACHGFNIAFTDRDENANCREIIDSGEKSGAKMLYIPSNLGAIEEHASLIDKVVTWGGSLDCLVNNAGIGTLHRGDLLDLSLDSFDAVMAINMRGSFFLTQCVARWMCANVSEQYRSIISISSVSAMMTSPDRADYCMSKAAMGMMTKAFALRLADENIGVFELRPGIIKTAMTASVSEKYDRRISEGLVPAKRWGVPEDIAQALLPFALGNMKFATGSTLQLDGGLSINRF